jgi:hypothetical protein
LLTDLYCAGERPFAPVFTLSDILSNIDVTQIEQRERNLKAIEAACRRLGCRPIERDGAVVRMRLGGSLQQTLWTLTAAHAETLGKEGNEKLGALYRTTREGNPRDLRDEPGVDAFDFDSVDGVEPEGTEA